MPHDHNHGHGEGCAHESSDSDYLKEIGIQYSLYTKIDVDNLECLNESVEGSAKFIFKPYEERLNFDKVMFCFAKKGSFVNWESNNTPNYFGKQFVESDADEELLFNIPFTGNIKLKGITIIGANDNSHPNKVRLFKNRPKLSFDDAASKPDEEFNVERNPNGEIEYPLK